MITAADIAAVLLIAIAASFAASTVFCLLLAPRALAAIRDIRAQDIRDAAQVSGDNQHPEWDEAVALGNSHTEASSTPIYDRLKDRRDGFDRTAAEIRGLPEREA